jgi:vancomycin resistance protein YoaR
MARPFSALRLRDLQLRDGARFAAMVLVCIGAGLTITYLLLPPPPVNVAALPEPPLRVAGSVLPDQGDAVGNALDLVRRYAKSQLELELPGGRKTVLEPAELGVEIDRARLAQFVREAKRPGSPVQRAYAVSQAFETGAPLDVPLPIRIDVERAIARLLDLKPEVDRPASDAYVDLEKRKLVPEQVGQRLDVYGTVARIEIALRRGETTAAARVEEVVPALVASELGAIEFGEVLGWFETRYNRGNKYKDRTYNLRLAASKLDGTIVMPGDVFDFNEVVGPRDEARGYRVAPVIAQGELVDGLGGGTCQISGTLHGAAFFAGLEIVERYPHSRPSFYITLGMDATVSYPTINYRFKNHFDFPIVLHQTVRDGVVRAEILGPRRRLMVTYFRRIDEILPFEEVERETDKIPDGERIVTQRGIPGFVTVSSRLVRDGAYGVREKWTDRYPPTTQIVEIGTGDGDAKGMHEDSHPEYVVDEYRVMTQEPDGTMRDKREPGDTGEAGWMEELGFAKSSSSDDDDDDDEDGKEGQENGEGDDPKADDEPDAKKKTKQAKSKTKPDGDEPPP